LVRRTLLQPIHSVTERIGAMADGRDHGERIEMPEFASSEMTALAREVERACQVRRAT
jgi:hypothetical protein